MNNKKMLVTILLCGLIMSGMGCRSQGESCKEEIPFSVCDRTKIPDELWKLMEEKKGAPYRLSYMNKQNLYIAIGYGEHDRNNLNVVVEELYKTSRSIFVKTNLITGELTPTDCIGMGEDSMCPYIVLKCDAINLPIIYED